LDQIKPNDKSLRAWYLLLFFLPIYGYFFQGGGWNQNAHFDLVRALVEEGTTRIDSYASNTGDISSMAGHTYSNKAPGFALIASLPYFVLYHAERSLGFDVGSSALINFNAHLLSFLLSALPAALLLLFLMEIFEDRGLAKPDTLLLTIFFGLGSLSLPYSGAFMPHNLVSCIIFVLWSKTSQKTLFPPGLAGFLSGLSLALDYSTLPVLALLFVWRFRSPLKFLYGASLPLLLLLLYNHFSFGSFWRLSYQATTSQFLDKDLVLGLFGVPKLERLYFLTFHPMKGLFYLSPIMLLGVMGLTWGVLKRRIQNFEIPALLIIIYYFLITLSMQTWTAGWGVGVRYLMPALPFIFYFSHNLAARLRALMIVLGIYSSIVVLAVSAVDSFMPAPNIWPVSDQELTANNPIQWASQSLRQGQLSINTQSMLEKFPSDDSPSDWDSYNLGELIGLRGLWSLLPLLGWVALGIFALLRAAIRGERRKKTLAAV